MRVWSLLLADDWWSPTMACNGEIAPRRILAIANGMVLYSDGMRKTKECSEAKFDTWIARYGCTCTRAGEGKRA